MNLANVESNNEINNQDIYKNALGIALVGGALFAGVKGGKVIKNALKGSKNGVKNPAKAFKKSGAFKQHNKRAKDVSGAFTSRYGNMDNAIDYKQISRELPASAGEGFKPHSKSISSKTYDSFIDRWGGTDDLSFRQK